MYTTMLLMNTYIQREYHFTHPFPSFISLSHFLLFWTSFSEEKGTEEKERERALMNAIAKYTANRLIFIGTRPQ